MPAIWPAFRGECDAAKCAVVGTAFDRLCAVGARGCAAADLGNPAGSGVACRQLLLRASAKRVLAHSGRPFGVRCRRPVRDADCGSFGGENRRLGRVRCRDTGRQFGQRAGASVDPAQRFCRVFRKPSLCFPRGFQWSNGRVLVSPTCRAESAARMGWLGADMSAVHQPGACAHRARRETTSLGGGPCRGLT